MKGLHVLSMVVCLLAAHEVRAAEAPACKSCEEKADAATESGAKIGLLDVNYVFKNYSRFTERMAELKSDVQRAEEEVKKSREEFMEMTKQLQGQTVGTPEYAALEAKMTATRAQMAASLDTRKKAFVRREGQIYYEAYEEMRREVKDYAKEKRLTAVVRFNDVAAGPGDPNAVRQHINRQIIWHAGACDLTRIILQRLEQKSKEKPSESAEEPPVEDPPAEEPPPEEPPTEQPPAEEQPAEEPSAEDAPCADHAGEPSDNANEGTLDKVTVAVIDMGYVFKNYSRFKEMDADLKAEVKQAEEAVKQKREELKNMIEQLKVHIVGTPEYTQLEKKIVAENAKTTNDIKFQQRDFQRRGAKITYEAYEVVVREVEDFAKTRELQCVFRFDGTEVNAGVPQDVARRMQQPLIWHDGVSDLTGIILERLEQRSKEQPSEPSEERPTAKEPPAVPPTADKPSTKDAPRLGRCGWRFLPQPV